MGRRSQLSFALALVVTASSVAGVAVHLCNMEGAVRSTCCCDRSERQAPPLKLESQDDCCDALRPQGEQPPALTSLDVQVELPQLWAAVATTPDPSRVLFAKTCPVQPVRGPPPRHGPPLFIRHCSLLN